MSFRCDKTIKYTNAGVSKILDSIDMTYIPDITSANRFNLWESASCFPPHWYTLYLILPNSISLNLLCKFYQKNT